jgi:adhesin transport system outer membrane protein
VAHIQQVMAADQENTTKGKKSKAQASEVNTAQLSDFAADVKNVDVLPTIYVQASSPLATGSNRNSAVGRELSLYDAVKIAEQRHPSISAAIAAIGQQNGNVDVAKSAYWPQVQSGVQSGRNSGSGASGQQQLLSVTADQTLYDFGKTKNNVKVYEAGVDQQKANLLTAIDEVAFQTADAVVNVARYQALVKINQTQVAGIARILDIARLRANAGLTSQADPIQAQSRYESSQSTLLDSKMQLRQWEEKLRTLIGIPGPYNLAALPDNLLKKARLFENPKPNELPSVIAAEYEKNAALAQKDLARSNRLPTLSVEGSLNKAISGVNPYTDKEKGSYSSIMLKVTGPTWQGGSLGKKERAANYAVEAARAKRDAAYLETADKIKTYREQILGVQDRLTVLDSREQSIKKTRELYEDQYKLGTRTVLDLLNSEQEIQFASAERENARFDTWENLVNYISVSGRTRQVYGLNDSTIQGVEIKP